MARKYVLRPSCTGCTFRGVGALALEYLLHSLLHQAVRACFDRGPLSGPLGASSGPLSGPFAQPVSPIISPRKQRSSYTPPLRDPTQFPTFGESVSQLEPSFGAPTPPFPFQSGRPNVFGSPPRSMDTHSSSSSFLPPLSLVTDRPDDPFSVVCERCKTP
ncbi:hypothetical protein ANCDUO_05515 [Ancylostoma duodenale]|uniref:Uncharacterized protein n=1 Tax=Ancylostoma duodenale TaxID=51022 RepID=A0A0C2GS86_9BILA|nr:hypothetical protein ANCDUO_05515 [Ancylostoma duodenale]